MNVFQVQHQAETGQPFEITQMCGHFTMDVIAGTAFGLQVDSQNNPEDPFVKHGKAMLNIANEYLICLRQHICRQAPLLTSGAKAGQYLAAKHTANTTAIQPGC